MNTNFVFINGSREQIYDNEDIIYIIQKYLGNDFAEVVSEALNGVVEEITPELKEEVLKSTDYYAYESDLEEHNSVFCDIRDITDELDEHFTNNKRINKDFVIRKINKINKIVISQI